MIGKISRVPLRAVWPHEARDFTAWLQENIEILGEAIGVPLTFAERERSVGDFNVDLVAEDGAGKPVVIENQLDRSDHDHLGKLLTYLVGVDAHTAIWIVSDPRPEHVGVISWLNETSAASFYLVKVEAICIGDSPPAPLLTSIVGPTPEVIAAGETKKELAERHLLRKEFWQGLLNRSRERTSLHRGVSPSTQSWLGTGAGKSGLELNYIILQHGHRVELYIDTSSAKENRAILDKLEASRSTIEATFGEPLLWSSPEGKRACSIRMAEQSGGLRDRELWVETQEKLIEAMIRFDRALRPYIRQLK